MFKDIQFEPLMQATKETLYMTFVTLIFVVIFGFVIGYAMYHTDLKKGYKKTINQGLVTLTNVARSMPFLILMILIMPLTKRLIGTILGPSAAIPALIISATPFYARLVFQSLREIPKSVIEMLESFGLNRLKMALAIIKESMPGLVSGVILSTVTLIGFSSISGIIGAGGLGHLAYQSGFIKNDQTMIVMATLFILLMVFVIQGLGDQIIKKIDKRI